MSQISIEKKNKLSPFMTELWTLLKQYGTPEESEQYWDKVLQAIGNLIHRHQDDAEMKVMVKALALGALEGLEEEYRGRFRGGYLDRVHCGKERW